jgi:hypothetical protein
MKSSMSSKQFQPNAAISAVNAGMPFFREELPLSRLQAGRPHGRWNRVVLAQADSGSRTREDNRRLH